MARNPFKFVWEVISHIGTAQWLIHTEFFRTYLLPLVVGSMTAGSGLMQHEPTMWVIVAASVAFMSMTVAVALLDVTRERKSPRNKLFYETTMNIDLMPAEISQLARRPGRRGQGNPRQPIQRLGPHQLNPQVNRQIDKAQIGVAIRNNSSFPISIILKHAATEIEHEMPPRSVFPKTPSVVPAGGVLRVMDDPVELDGMPCRRLSAVLNMTISYGLPGREIYEMHIEGPVDIIVEQFGFVSHISTMVGPQTVV